MLAWRAATLSAALSAAALAAPAARSYSISGEGHVLIWTAPLGARLFSLENGAPAGEDLIRAEPRLGALLLARLIARLDARGWSTARGDDEGAAEALRRLGYLER